MAAIEGDDRSADGIPVEVKLDDGGYFPASLMDIINGEALIHFPYGWMPEDRYNFSRVRFPPVDSTPRSALKENMIAEVMINKNQGFHKGWFKCCILMLKSEFCLFEYLDTQNISDFGYIRNLRKPNMNPKLSMNMLHVYRIYMPVHIREYAKCKNVHRILKNWIKSALVNYDADRGELVIISRNIADISLAKVLANTHLEYLSKTVHVLKQAEKLKRKLENAKRDDGFTAEFTVPKSYLGWAIGREKVHLRAAKKIKGITIIQLIRKSNKFIIHGETEEAVNEARKLLEIKIEPYPVLEEHMSQLIEKLSTNIYDILEGSGAADIYLEDTKDSQENKKMGKNRSLYIIGTAKAIAKAELFLQLEIDHICEVQRLRGVRQELLEQIDAIIRTDTTSKSVVLPTQTRVPTKHVSFVNNLSNYNMDEIKELKDLNGLLSEDRKGAVDLDVIFERNIETTDINLENTNTRAINQEDLDLVQNISKLKVSVESNGVAVLDVKSKPETHSSGVYEILRKHPIAIQTRSIATQVQEDVMINLDTRSVHTQTSIEDEMEASTSIFKETSGITQSGEIGTAEISPDTNGAIETLCDTLIEVKSRYILKETSGSIKSGGNAKTETKKRVATPGRIPVKTKKLKSTLKEIITKNIGQTTGTFEINRKDSPSPQQNNLDI